LSGRFRALVATLVVRLSRRRRLPKTFNKETFMTDVASTVAPAAAPVQPAVDPRKLVTSVVDTVQGHPDVAPSRAASVITDILAGLYQAQPAIFAVSRASERTQAQVSLGLGLAEIIVGAFLRRSA
jgi:hypothetical protein